MILRRHPHRDVSNEIAIHPKLGAYCHDCELCVLGDTSFSMERGLHFSIAVQRTA